MAVFRVNSHIAAPAPRVWSVLADVVRWPDWLNTVSRVEPLDSVVLDLGARYRIEQPRLSPAVWTVVELDPPHRFTWMSRRFGLSVVADHVVSAAGEAAATVTLEMVCRGPLRQVAVWVGGRLTRDYIEREAASLKQVVEAVS